MRPPFLRHLQDGALFLLAIVAAGWFLIAAPTPRKALAQGPSAFATGNLTTVNDNLVIDVSQSGAAAVQLAGTWSGTVTFEGSVDRNTFVALNFVPSNSATAATTATANGAWNANIGGYRLVRARFTTATSGTVNVALSAAGSGGK